MQNALILKNLQGEATNVQIALEERQHRKNLKERYYAAVSLDCTPLNVLRLL